MVITMLFMFYIFRWIPQDVLLPHLQPIHTSHNSHTHTGNTRQFEPQLKDSSCSSAIPSHNSRDAILSHNSRNATYFPSIPSHNLRDTVLSRNSRNTPTRQSLRYHQCLVNHTHPKQQVTSPNSALLPSAALELLGEIELQTA